MGESSEQSGMEYLPVPVAQGPQILGGGLLGTQSRRSRGGLRVPEEPEGLEATSCSRKLSHVLPLPGQVGVIRVQCWKTLKSSSGVQG